MGAIDDVAGIRRDVGGIVALVGGFGVLFFIVKEYCRLQDERRARRERDISDFMLLHHRALARKRWQLVQSDDYGNRITKKWEKEKRYFISTVLVPYLIDLGHVHAPVLIDKKTDKVAQERLYQEFDLVVEQWAAQGSISNNDDIANIATGREYERFCADRLVQAGWKTELTKATGDQGVDIVGELDGLRVVFQCKFYTSPVGNKAVQEAVAARLYERADLAVVISNAPFTQSAETLARTTQTLLVHHDDIPSLKEILKTRKAS